MASTELLRPVMRFARLAVEIVFPPRCAVCGRRGWWVCDECTPNCAAIVDPTCDRCGIPKDTPCRCSELSPALDRVRSAVWYEQWPRNAIVAFKYEGESARAPHLANLIAPNLTAFPSDSLLVPVPLHPTRERRRGYNQATLLARELSKSSGLAVAPALLRAVETRQQVGLSAAERAVNVRGAFTRSRGNDLAGQACILIDDVTTTGATLGACAEVLKGAGAGFVGALTVARDR
jgi:ComF family protein